MIFQPSRKEIVLASYLTTGFAAADNLSITGTSFSTFYNQSDQPLDDGSIIQVGYFLGLNPADTDPSEFGASQWNTFTAITGPGSPNPDITPVIESNSFLSGIYQLDLVVPEGLPSFPAFLGLRVFDTTIPSEITSAEFNTVASTKPEWIAQSSDEGPPTPVPPRPELALNLGGQPENAEAYWQFANNPFQTVIPEPSSSLLILLSSLAIVSGRRRQA